MDRIRKVWSAMDKSERRAFKAFLEALKTSSGSDKQLALLNLLNKDPLIEQSQASKKLYKDERSKAFIMMKSRLYDRMVEFLGMVRKFQQDPSEREMPYAKDLVECRRHLLISTVLGQCSLSDLMMDHLVKALELAKSCQSPETEADILVRIRANIFKSPYSFEDLTQQLQGALERISRDAHALGVFKDFYSKFSLKDNLAGEAIAYLDKHVPELELRLKQHYSPRADHYFLFLQTLRQKYYRNFSEARKSARKALELLEIYPGLRSSIKFADASFQLANIEIRLENFKEGIKYLEQSQAYLSPESNSYFIATATLITAWIHDGQVDRAWAECQKQDVLSKNPVMVVNSSTLGFHTFTKSCLLFLRKEFKAALNLMLTIDDLITDKVGWGTGLRIFEVLILVEMGEYELAESKMEPLRKHIERYGCSDREVLIYRLLRGQGRRFFSFEHFPEEEELLLALAAPNDWDPVGRETIRVDAWYRAKQKALGF